MKNLLLIHPATRSNLAGFGDVGAWRMPPLCLAYVAALTPSDWDIKIVDEYIEPVDMNAEVDLVGITTYSANATRAYELSGHFRSRGIPVVLGGIHVSMCPEEASEYADAIVVGEAESVWGNVLSDFESDNLQKIYHAERLPLVDLPIPRRDLLSDKYEMDVIQTSRGCPFACEFCSITAFNGAEHRQRPIDEVLTEFSMLKKDIVYVLDDNIVGAGPAGQERALALFKGILDRKIKKIWGAQASINVSDNEEVLKYAYRSGCRTLYIGIESVATDNLQQMNKGVNLKVGVDGFKERIKLIHKHGMAVVGAFIVGLDHDDLSVLKRTLNFINESRIDVFDLSFLTPYPGTKLFDRLEREGRLICSEFPDDWDYCGGDNIMIKPANMSIVELVHGFDYIVRRKLNRWQIIRQFFRTWADTRDFISALMAYNLNKGQRTALDPEREMDRLFKLSEETKSTE